MARLVYRLWGTITIVVGVVGVVLSILAIGKTSSTAERFARELPEVFGQLEVAMHSVNHQGDAAVDVLQKARYGLDSIRVTVEDLSRDKEGRQIASVLETFDTGIVERLVLAEEFVKAMGASLNQAGSAILFLEAMPFLRPRVHLAAEEDDHLKHLAIGLTEISGILQQVSDILSDIRTKRAVDPKELARLQAGLDRVDEELSRIQSDFENFSGEVKSLSRRLSDARRNSLKWITRTANIASLFFLCFAFSQISLVLHGWRCLRRAGSREVPKSEA